MAIPNDPIGYALGMRQMLPSERRKLESEISLAEAEREARPDCRVHLGCLVPAIVPTLVIGAAWAPWGWVVPIAATSWVAWRYISDFRRARRELARHIAEGESRARLLRADLSDGRVQVERVTAIRAARAWEKQGPRLDPTFFDLGDGRFYALRYIDIEPEPDDDLWPPRCMEVVTTVSSGERIGVRPMGERLSVVRALDESKIPLDLDFKSGDIFVGSWDSLEDDLMSAFFGVGA